MTSTIQSKQFPLFRETNSRNKKAIETVEDFEKWQRTKKSGYNYEFYYGRIIKKPAMKQIELSIIQFLTRRFAQTKAYQEYGELVTEMDTYIDVFRKRVPDMAYFSYKQIVETTKGIKVVPAFAIEILSDSESYSDVEDKIQDYFDAGIKTVWYILPKTQRIHVYTSAKSMQVYQGNDTCVAEPVLVDFKFVVSDLFKPLL